MFVWERAGSPGVFRVSVVSLHGRDMNVGRVGPGRFARASCVLCCTTASVSGDSGDGGIRECAGALTARRVWADDGGYRIAVGLDVGRLIDMVSPGMMEGLLLCELDRLSCSRRLWRLWGGHSLMTLGLIMRQLNALSISDDCRVRCELGHHW